MAQEIETAVLAIVIGFTLIVSPIPYGESTAIGKESWGEYPKDRDDETSYIFTSKPSPDTVYDQTLNVLGIYKFPIDRTDRENRHIETGWKDIKRGGHKIFTVKYRIQIDGDPTRITVVASTKGASSRHARNSGWWLIKKIVRMTEGQRIFHKRLSLGLCHHSQTVISYYYTVMTLNRYRF